MNREAKGVEVKSRRFGKLGWEVSALGFGCMRLPTKGDDHANIDEPEATRMVRWAIDHGVTYLDTGYPYHRGNSERFLGRALKDGYREKVRLATKLPIRLMNTSEDTQRIFNEQLEKLQTDDVDFYLLHALNKDRWAKVREWKVLEWLERAIEHGRIGYLGFSFHDEYEVFEEIVSGYDWTFCQIQHNYMDIENQAGTKGLRYAASKGLGVIIMEPLLGGRLVTPPEPVQELWDTAKRKRTPADWALQWLWSQPEVSVVLSGMSAMQHVQENVASAARSSLGLLTQEELALVAKVRERYSELCPVPCTQCRYCMPCPNGVDIPRNFEIFNEGRMYNQVEAARQAYERLSEGERASACIQCRECEEKCPQQIPISEWMIHVHEVLGEGQPYEACIMLDGE